MSGFMVFGLLLTVFVLLRERRRRWRRWAVDPRLNARWGGPPWEYRHPAGLDAREPEGTVEQLETRVARLEERLDFTEKLLMERGRKLD